MFFLTLILHIHICFETYTNLTTLQNFFIRLWMGPLSMWIWTATRVEATCSSWRAPTRIWGHNLAWADVQFLSSDCNFSDPNLWLCSSSGGSTTRPGLWCWVGHYNYYLANFESLVTKLRVKHSSVSILQSLFTEFATYNVNINLFVVVTIAAEWIPGSMIRQVLTQQL